MGQETLGGFEVGAWHAKSSFIYLLAVLGGLQDLSSPTRDCTQATAVKALSPNHWNTREVPLGPLFDPSRVQSHVTIAQFMY